MKISGNPDFNRKEGRIGECRLILLALIPSVFVGLIHFGVRALGVLLLSIGTGVLCDFLHDVLCKKTKKIHEDTVLICLLLALILPSTLPWYCVIPGSAFAVVAGKYAFTDSGDYFLNPVLIAKVFLLLSFAGPMGRFFYGGQLAKTPLESLMAGEGVNTMKLFLGNTAGTIGTTGALAVLLGAVFLLCVDVIRLEMPIGILAGFLVIALFFGTPAEGMSRFHYLVAEICSGELLFGAFFMATDPVTLPRRRREQVVLGLFIGITAACLRFYGNSKDGITYAILAGNLLLPLSRRIRNIREERKRKKEALLNGNS